MTATAFTLNEHRHLMGLEHKYVMRASTSRVVGGEVDTLLGLTKRGLVEALPDPKFPGTVDIFITSAGREALAGDIIYRESDSL